MRLTLLILGLTALTARAADSEGLHYSRPADRREITAVVEAQLAAFRANDFDKAYGFAAQGLRQQFTVEQFTVMITRGYPLILHNERAEFGLPQDDGTSAVLSVQVFAAGNQSAAYRYLLVKESAGSTASGGAKGDPVWRITGVTPEKPRTSDA
jgi:hypothetical protein